MGIEPVPVGAVRSAGRGLEIVRRKGLTTRDSPVVSVAAGVRLTADRELLDGSSWSFWALIAAAAAAVAAADVAGGLLF